MPLQVRRVVTGHDGSGRAVVKIDEVAQNVRSGRPGHESCDIWATQSFPVDNTGDDDPARATRGTTVPNGSVLRVIRYEPGVAPRSHRTDSIDYAIILAGEIDMELEGNDAVHLKAGDVVVQRGTIHNWINNGTEACTIAFVLIDAKPVEVGGRVLQATG